MRVMVFIKAIDDGASRPAPSPEAFAAMDRFTEELAQAGVMVAGAGLKPMSETRRIQLDGGSKRVLDGPFAETRELIAGFSIWEVRDMEDAMSWAMRYPNPGSGKCEVEIRPFLEAADLSDYITPEDLSTPRPGARGKLDVA